MGVGGKGRVNEENPRSRVMPRSLDCGCLSRAAVERVVDRAATRLVLPLSTWPKTPMLMLHVEGRRGGGRRGEVDMWITCHAMGCECFCKDRCNQDGYDLICIGLAFEANMFFFFAFTSTSEGDVVIHAL